MTQDDFRAALRLQRTMLRSLGFEFLHEAPDFPAPAPRQKEQGTGTVTARPATRAPEPRKSALPTLSRAARPDESGRNAALDAVATEAEACTACDLHLTRKRAIAGEGSRSARLFVIGEAPSEDDDAAGSPFRGGELEELMTNIVKAIGFTREEVYITHAVKCRPPRGRSPHDGELSRCHDGFLARQVEVIHPDVILCFGQAALQALLPGEETRSLSKWRGKWLDYRGIPVMPTFSLPYIVRNRERKKTVWEDLKEVIERLKGE